MIRLNNTTLLHVRWYSNSPSPPELMREFIFDSLYNRKYGYFSKSVNIFHSPKPIPFPQIKDQDEYGMILKNLYDNNNIPRYEDIPLNQRQESSRKFFHQLWHTPSELFKPFYGRAIANFILHKKHDKSRIPLIIYEIGPGNGTMAENILDFIKEDHADIYETIEYNLIEISDQLRTKQISRLKSHKDRVKFPKLEVLNLDQSNFKDERDCWILGMEVLDNLAHDMIKFRCEDGQLLEAVINTNPQATYGSIPGKYWQEFREGKDQQIIEYVKIGQQLGWKWASLKGKPLLRALERYSPLGYINPWSCEFIPTDSFKLLKNLTKSFPKHRAIFSDFHDLPDTVKGHNGPVVQTRFRNVTVPCSSVLLERGLFDIFFPTDFLRLAQIHAHIRPGFSQTVQKHSEFIKTWTKEEDLLFTTTKSGYNPMIQDFENVSFYSCV